MAIGGQAGQNKRDRSKRSVGLGMETLESRYAMNATATLADGLLSIVGDGANDTLRVRFDPGPNQMVFEIGAVEAGRFGAGDVTRIQLDGGAGNDTLTITNNVTQPATILGGAGNDVLQAGGGRTKLQGGDGNDTIFGGARNNQIDSGAGDDAVFGGAGKNKVFGGAGNDNLQGNALNDALFGGIGDDTLAGADGNDFLAGGDGNDLLFGNNGHDKLFGGRGDDMISGGGVTDCIIRSSGQDFNLDTNQTILSGDLNNVVVPPAPASTIPESTESLTAAEVDALLRRAAAASSSSDGIFAIVDRNGRILGVRVESGVSAALLANPTTRVFAIDGAVAKARTGAFFANNGAPLTSRTVQFISQTTILEREVKSNPNIADPNSTQRGPGFVAPIGIGGHFPPINFTPTANLFAIEHTNRDGLLHPGADARKGTGDDVNLPNRFNIPSAAFANNAQLFAPESYGVESGVLPAAQSRGVATLPGGVGIYKNGQLVGGIGVFYPGQTGFASEENSQLSVDYNPNLPDRSLEAEYVVFATLGGSLVAPIGDLAGQPPVAGVSIGLPIGARIDVDGITVPIYGPLVDGLGTLQREGQRVGVGNPNDGVNQPLVAPDLVGANTRNGRVVSTGWIVNPRAGGNLSADEVRTVIEQGIVQAQKTRAAIRTGPFRPTAMVLAVSDTDGNVLGLFRMPDATIFSIDVAVAKSRNTAYYADPAQLDIRDAINEDGNPAQADLPAGTAFTNRTFRFGALPFFPTAIEGQAGPYSILNDGQANQRTALNNGAPLPASAFQSVMGYDAFNPGTNFRDTQSAVGNTNGIVFFPGSVPLYKDINGDGVRELVGGFGISGDGVDQDDVVTEAGAKGFEAPANLRVDSFNIRGVRLPYQKFNRNPEEI